MTGPDPDARHSVERISRNLDAIRGQDLAALGSAA